MKINVRYLAILGLLARALAAVYVRADPAVITQETCSWGYTTPDSIYLSGSCTGNKVTTSSGNANFGCGGRIDQDPHTVTKAVDFPWTGCAGRGRINVTPAGTFSCNCKDHK